MLILDLQITFESALYSFVRDSRGRPCIPAATLKGAHRFQTEQIAAALGLRICTPPIPEAMCQPLGAGGQSACVVCRIFGSPWLPGSIYYQALAATTTPTIAMVVTVSQSRQRRVQLERHVTQRAALPAGTRFQAQLNHRINDPALLGLALAGLRSITAFGAYRANGGGRCRVEVHALDEAKRPVNDSDLAAALRQLTLTHTL